jgi:hypothetical protein
MAVVVTVAQAKAVSRNLEAMPERLGGWMPFSRFASQLN